MRKCIILLIIIGIYRPANAQSDSASVLLFDDFYKLVLQHHPIVKKANLLSEIAAQDLRLARGSFDPKLEGGWNVKSFQNKTYYNKLDVGLKIPTWFPIDPVVGVQRNSGSQLNPENYISSDLDYQQVYAGISVPIGQGLFLDQRRATLRKAQLLQDMAEAEQVKEINKILLTATKDYWNWYFAYNNYALLQRSILLAQDIFERTKMAFEQGEAAVIDTVQAKINLLSRISAMQQADIARIQAALVLSTHLWTESGQPLELDEKLRPGLSEQQVFPTALLDELQKEALLNHPELRKLKLKRQSLAIDQRLARENIKPVLNFKYYLLDQPFNAEGKRVEPTLNDNYKFGLEFALPIFIRKERAKLSMTSIKMEQNSYQSSYAEQQVINEINSQFEAASNTSKIIEIQTEMVKSYEQILQAERLNMSNGESDNFKINIQMDKLIEAQSKLYKLQSTYQKDVATLYWAAGIGKLKME